jgi:hypothetical protein
VNVFILKQKLIFFFEFKMEENMENDNSKEFANLSETKPHEIIQNKTQDRKNLISNEKEQKYYPKNYNYICQKKEILIL